MKPIIGSISINKDSNVKELLRNSSYGALTLIAVMIIVSLLGLDLELIPLIFFTLAYSMTALVLFLKADSINKTVLNWLVTASALLYISSIVYLTGGLSSPFIGLYLVWVAMEMLWISVDKGVFVAFISLLTFSILMFLQYFKIIDQGYFISSFNPYESHPYMIILLTGFIGTFGGVTYLVRLLALSLMQKRQELLEANIEINKKVNELEFFYNVSKDTTDIQTFDVLTNYFLKSISSAVKANRCAMYLHEATEFVLENSLGKKFKNRIDINPLDYQYFDVKETQAIETEKGPIQKALGTKGRLLYIPLISKDDLIGFIIVQGHESSRESISLVNALVPQISSSTHNSLLYNELERKEKEAEEAADYLRKNKEAVLNILEDISILNIKLEKAIAQTKSMYRIAVDISKSIELDILLDSILNNAMSLVSADAGIIMLTNKGKLVPYKENNFNMKSESKDFPWNDAFNKRDTVVVNDLNKYKDFSAKHKGYTNSISVPLIQNKRILGLICLFNKPKDFNEEDKKLIITLANQATITLLNAKILEREKETVKKLKELDRMKDDFVASVSHELKSPLTSIKGYLELLLEEEAGEVSRKQKEFLEIISQSSERLHRVIIDLLTFSKIESDKLNLKKEPNYLNEVLKKSITSIKPEMDRKQIRLKTNIEDNLPLVKIDSDRIDQVILNLLSNAIKFTEKQGTIQVEVKKEGNKIIASVADSGIGISNEDQSKLFTRFFRSAAAVTRRTPGTGLGLAICKGIIEQHKGKMWVESEVGVGSVFSFHLPICRIDSKEKGRRKSA